MGIYSGFISGKVIIFETEGVFFSFLIYRILYFVIIYVFIRHGKKIIGTSIAINKTELISYYGVKKK